MCDHLKENTHIEMKILKNERESLKNMWSWQKKTEMYTETSISQMPYLCKILKHKLKWALHVVQSSFCLQLLILITTLYAYIEMNDEEKNLISLSFSHQIKSRKKYGDNDFWSKIPLIIYFLKCAWKIKLC